MQRYVLTYKDIYPDDTITIISFQYPAQKEYYWFGVRIIAIGGENSWFPMRFVTWYRAISAFKKIHKAMKVDIIHSFWLTECSFIGYYLARKYSIPMLAAAQGQDCAAGNRYYKVLNLNKIYVTALSQFIADHLYKNTGKLVERIIPFGERLVPLPIDSGAARDIDILGVGSVVPVKNYTMFVEVIAELMPAYPTLNVMLVGNQPDQAELSKIRNRINRLNLQDIITLTGEIAPDEVLKTMSHAKILLHTSLFEGQAMVYSEALSCGMTIVCSNVGRIFPDKMMVCETKEEMAEVIRKLLYDNLFDYRPVYHETMEETVKEYHELYHTL